MFRPLHGLVTVVLDPKVDCTEGGIMLPDTAEASHLTGTVRAAGPEAGYKKDGVDHVIQPGDRVMIGAQKDPRTRRIVNFGTINDGGVEVALVNYQDIWGTLTTDKTNG